MAQPDVHSPGLRTGRTRRSWFRQGAATGLACGLAAPLGILLLALSPALLGGYVLVLVPLVIVGPFASRGLPVPRGLGAAALAGLIAGVVSSVSLAVGMRATSLGWAWSLTMPATAAPMPSLPRVTLLPQDLMTWPQQDILVFEPLLALALAGAALLLRAGLPLVLRPFAWLAPRSISTRLTLALGGITLLTFSVGGVGFNALEEMHFRAHSLQFQVDLQRHLSEAQQALGNEQAAALNGADPTPSAAAVDALLTHVMAATAHPAIAVSPTEIAARVSRYQADLASAAEWQRRYRAQPGNQMALVEASRSLDWARTAVDADAVLYMDNSDLEHHQRLMAILVVVAVAAGIGLWLTTKAVSAVTTPIGALAEHVRRVALGDFSGRAPAGGAEEMQRLGIAVNRMTEDLDRLYAAERGGRAAAEAMAMRERELAAAKEFWTNTVVHDLKGPLSIIAGYAEMLDSQMLGSLNERQKGAVAEMFRATGELTGLAADINDSFRLEAEALPMHLDPVDPTRILSDAAGEHSRPDLGVPLVQVPAALPAVLADSRLVRRVLRNLVGNAYKHAGARARVVLSASPAAEGQVLFAIEDDGPGIPPAHQDRVFERFVQGDGAGPGSGLGLAFCKLVIERHGGRIWVEPRSGDGGTRVCFTLLSTARPAAPADSIPALLVA